MEQRPILWRCNACGAEGKTSKEHLIHVAIGRVILNDKRLSREQVRERLQDKRHRGFQLYNLEDGFPMSDEQIEGPAWFNQEIRGLICVDCNEDWARILEENAGNNLYDFTHLYGKADGTLLRRWAWFFAVKLWWGHSRTESLADGPLLPILSKLAQLDANVEMPVRVARLTSSTRTWDFSSIMRGWAGRSNPYIFWIIGGVVWMVVGKPPGPIRLPIRTTELVDGLTLPRVPTIRKRDLVRAFTAPSWRSPNRS